ncbi:MAG: hypothetical protein HY855_08945 [Burkholderiales bacterium]|nr:hypothetical protein [Burkholderiales bacterium]
MGDLVQQNVPLVSDPESKTLCVSKLERCRFQTRSVISLIPRRPGEKSPIG